MLVIASVDIDGGIVDVVVCCSLTCVLDVGVRVVGSVVVVLEKCGIVTSVSGVDVGSTAVVVETSEAVICDSRFVVQMGVAEVGTIVAVVRTEVALVVVVVCSTFVVRGTVIGCCRLVET